MSLFPFKFGVRISRVYFWLKRSQWYSEKQIQDYQRGALKDIVSHVYNNIPYYRKIFDERGLRPGDIESRGDLTKLPFLTKELIRKNYKDLIWTKAKTKNKISCCTSGSTAEPLEFKLDRKALLLDRALYFRSWGWAGWRDGMRIAAFRPFSQTLNHNKKIFYYAKLKTLYLSPYVLSKEILEEYLSILEKFKPHFINAHPSTLSIIVKYLKHNKKNNIFFHLKAILTLGTTLYPDLRKEIEDHFHCPIFDWYGMSECIVSANECDRHRGYHVNFEQGILEIAENDKRNEIVGTTLINKVMPFIRYKIKDEVEVSNGVCSCGRGRIILKSIFGKEKDTVITPDRRVITGVFFTMLAYNRRWISHIQFIQEKIDVLRVKIVKMYEPNQSQIQEFLDPLKEALGSRVRVDFEFVEDTEVTGTGKRNSVISKITPEF